MKFQDSFGEFQDSFNFHLFAMRQTIERAFGIFMRRCVQLSVLCCHALSLLDCLILFHAGFIFSGCLRTSAQFCIRMPQGDPPGRWLSDTLPGDMPQVISNEEICPGRQEGIRRTRHQLITKTLRERGIVRPR
jgi:hypothetical protein